MMYILGLQNRVLFCSVLPVSSLFEEIRNLYIYIPKQNAT